MIFSNNTTTSHSFSADDSSVEHFGKELNKIDIIRSLYVGKCCAWPDCMANTAEFETVEEFATSHLDTEHNIDMNERIQRDLLKQIRLVTRLELELSCNRALLAGMLGHIDGQVKQGKQFILQPADVNEEKEEELVQRGESIATQTDLVVTVDQEVDARVDTAERGVQHQVETMHKETQVDPEPVIEVETRDTETQFEGEQIEEVEQETQTEQDEPPSLLHKGNIFIAVDSILKQSNMNSANCLIHNVLDEKLNVASQTQTEGEPKAITVEVDMQQDEMRASQSQIEENEPVSQPRRRTEKKTDDKNSARANDTGINFKEHV
jgi:hypothetical protein